MRIAVETRTANHESEFLDALASTCATLGHDVTRNMYDPADLHVIWNGRGWPLFTPTIICELGWLPRWSYQVSYTGINAAHHAAPWVWDGKPISKTKASAVTRHVKQCKAGNPHGWGYTQVVMPGNVPFGKYILCPLQVETDTNMKHVPESMRTVSGFMRAVSFADLPVPVMFKQHPAQRPPINPPAIRSQDVVTGPKEGTVYGILQDKNCIGVLTLNSNTAHDALLYGKPAIVLGNNVWPTEPGPFWTTLPTDTDSWHLWQEWQATPQRKQATAAYISHIMATQWALAEADNPKKVAALINETIKATQEGAKMEHVEVNVVAADMGWLFEDLKALYNQVPGVYTSERAIPGAESYMYLRPSEARNTPAPELTTVQLHSFFSCNPKRRAGLNKAAGVVCCNPRHIDYMIANRIALENKRLMIQPIGAPEAFTVRAKEPPTGSPFRVAWIGRNTPPKCIDRFVTACAKAKQHIPSMVAVLLGEWLESTAKELTQKGVKVDSIAKNDVGYGKYPEIYKGLDCVVITSDSECGPLVLFEALATGLPVIATKCGWCEAMIKDGVTGFLVDNGHPAKIAERIRDIARERSAWFARRYLVRAMLQGATLEGWIENTVAAAKEVRK